ncbi:DNA polymerase I, partial [bacterium]|nr:DNA polymerase I [bacterium]
PLINSKGEHTGAVYGLTRFIMRIIEEEAPEYLVVVFDTPKKTFRHKVYKEYKGTRKPMPEDMSAQLPRMREMIAAFGIPIIEVPAYEADDVMATLGRMANENGDDVFYVTGDKDFMQLVNDKSVVYNMKRTTGKAEIIGPAEVKEKMGVPPERVIDYLALMGDSADNIPGAKGIGPKGARKLLEKFDTVENLLKNAETISATRQRESIMNNTEMINLSKYLVTIDRNVPLETGLEALRYRGNQLDKLKTLFQELDFTSLIDLENTGDTTFKSEYTILSDMAKVSELADTLKKAGEFTFDLETTSINPLLAEIVGFSFCIQAGYSYYIPVNTSGESSAVVDLFAEIEQESELKIDIKPVLSVLQLLFENPDIRKCGQNIKYDALVLSNYDVTVKGITFDTMVASYVLNPERRQHNLDALALETFNFRKIPTSDIIGKGKKEITMDRVPVEKVAEYACEDADMTQRLKEHFAPQIKSENLDKLFEEIEMPLVPVLLEMEKNGIVLDCGFLAGIAEKLDASMIEIVKQIDYEAGVSINLNSPKQLSDLLFNKMKLPPVKKTRTGFSTDQSVLEILAKQYELPKLIIQYRQLSKLQSTYVLALPKLVNPKTGRIHTSFNQTVATTGRLSSSNPNLQNIPIRTEQGREIRRAFITCDSEHVLLAADYSQVELRIMAHLSGDTRLRDAFQNEEDIHRQTAALMFDLDAAAVTTEQRRQAKAINFGIMYGMGAYGLASRLEITNDEAKEFIEAYFATYQGVQKYMSAIIAEAGQKGYVETMLGRRRRLPEIMSDNRQRREFAERTAINTPIQGTAADLIKIAMINIHQRLQAEALKTKMLLQVHDELIFEVPQVELEYIQKLVREEMESAIQLDVPLKVEMGIGQNWLEAH